MAEFAAREGDELVTRTYLRAELAELRKGLVSGEVLATKEFVRAELAELKSDLTIRMVSVVAVATGVLVAVGR